MWPGLWAETMEKKHLHFQTEHRSKSGYIFPVEIHSHYYERGGEQFVLAICNKASEVNLREQQLLTQELQVYREVITKRIEEGDQELKALLEKAFEDLD
jgi:carbonic anhydrase